STTFRRNAAPKIPPRYNFDTYQVRTAARRLPCGGVRTRLAHREWRIEGNRALVITPETLSPLQLLYSRRITRFRPVPYLFSPPAADNVVMASRGKQQEGCVEDGAGGCCYNQFPQYLL